MAPSFHLGLSLLLYTQVRYDIAALVADMLKHVSDQLVKSAESFMVPWQTSNTGMQVSLALCKQTCS